eukprot:5524347-Prymnesium_polylepis.2
MFLNFIVFTSKIDPTRHSAGWWTALRVTAGWQTAVRVTAGLADRVTRYRIQPGWRTALRITPTGGVTPHGGDHDEIYPMTPLPQGASQAAHEPPTVHQRASKIRRKRAVAAPSCIPRLAPRRRRRRPVP